MKLVNAIAPALFASAILSSAAFAETFEVTITNTTAGQVITPPVVLTHKAVKLFTLGQPAPEYLVPLAEDGDTSAFVGADTLDVVSDVVIAESPILPGHSATLTVETSSDHSYISLAGMFATSNDAFVAINGKPLNFNGTASHFYANVYDAGSEANSEDCQFIPGPPCGNGGIRDTNDAEGFVHIHSGIHGIKDLIPSHYSWNNPGALVSIKMK